MVYKVSEGLFDTQKYILGCLRAISHVVQICDVIQPVLLSKNRHEKISLIFFHLILSLLETITLKLRYCLF